MEVRASPAHTSISVVHKTKWNQRFSYYDFNDTSHIQINLSEL
jgi:hypothetical protein